MKKFSELVKKLTVVGNDYVPIIDSQAESDADKNKATLFSTILTYLRGETIRNTGTVTDEGMYALDAKQGNPNVAGTLANILSYLSGGTLMGTLDDNTIPTGLYRLNGNSATGTLPNDNAKYGTLLVVNRWNNGFQLLLSESGVYERAVTSNNLTAAWKDVFGKYFGGITSIPANANLNTYTTPGEYYIASNSTAASLSNSPSQKAGRLTVEFGGQYKADAGWIRQTYIEYDGGIFTRTSINTGSTWTDWKQYIPAAAIRQMSIYTTSTATKIKYNSDVATESGTTTKIIVYPNLKLAWVRLAFDIGTIASNAWYTVATLPVSASTVENFTATAGGTVGSFSTDSKLMDVSFQSNTLRFYIWASASGKRVFFNEILSIE